jgi:hypothetical protein
MTPNNYKKILFFWRQFLKFFEKIIKPIKEQLLIFTEKNPNIAQNIQLTFTYFFAIIDLVSSILNYIYSLGFFPEILANFYPYIHWLLMSPLLQLWASPERVFMLSYVVIELMVVRSVFKFSKLVRYNILLIFSLLMLQGLVISYWDVLCHREIAKNIAKFSYDEGLIIFSDKILAFWLFFITFVFFMMTYLYLYIVALTGKLATFPGCEWLTDSVCFWLKIKTPTMRFGNGKKDDKRK